MATGTSKPERRLAGRERHCGGNSQTLSITGTVVSTAKLIEIIDFRSLFYIRIT